MLAESKAKCALGAAMPHAFKMASSMLIELAVGELGGGGAWLGDSVVLEGVCAVAAVAAVFGSGFGSDPHPIDAIDNVPRSAMTPLMHRAWWVVDLMGLLLCS